MIARFISILLAALLVPFGAVGCSGDDGDDAGSAQTSGESNGAASNGGKTDTPDDAPEDSCTKRRADALSGNQRVFTKDAIRWSCADVEGVNNNNQDDRGQEYCEHFAAVRLPPEEEGGEWPEPITTGRITSVEPNAVGLIEVKTTPLSIELTDDQIFYLEDYPDEVLGHCVFTSWHADIPGPVPNCEGEDATCPDVAGIPVSADIYRMKLDTNANEAASALVEDCLLGDPQIGDPDKPDDLFHSDFYRGCILTAELYGTEWRRSDPAVCAAAMRMKECGCTLPDNADIPTSLVPRQPQMDAEGKEVYNLRGFPLGTWASRDTLPSGCSYVELGDTSQTVVSCNLTALDLLDHASDLKRRCIEKYGDNVVVYVPVPAELITCEPPEGGAYADTCTETPWVVTQ